VAVAAAEFAAERGPADAAAAAETITSSAATTRFTAAAERARPLHAMLLPSRTEYTFP